MFEDAAPSGGGGGGGLSGGAIAGIVVGCVAGSDLGIRSLVLFMAQEKEEPGSGLGSPIS